MKLSIYDNRLHFHGYHISIVIAIVLVLLALFGLSGCASLEQAGHTSYVVRPFTAPNGSVMCCEAQFTDGKEYTGGRVITLQTTPLGVAFQVQEGESKAFRGQGIAAKAIPLPVTGLQEMLK